MPCSVGPSPNKLCVIGHVLTFQIKYIDKFWSHIGMKGTHARDFHSLFLTFCCIYPLIDIKHRRANFNFFDSLFWIRPSILNFISLNVFDESTWSKTKHFRQKRYVKWCIFGDNMVLSKIRLCRGILNSLFKLLDILDLPLVYYWMMSK
jgi:hypothetical protein